jgi:SAM-dependent methyltransferase
MEREEYIRMFSQETEFWWYKTLQELILSFMKTQQKTKQLKILDAGCGTGRMAELLSDFGEVYAFDYSPFAIELAKKRKKIHFTIQNINTWKEEPFKFDIIVCNDVLSHSSINSDYDILVKFYNSLKNDGILITNNSAFEILKRNHDNVVHQIKRYRKKEFLTMIKSIGFIKVISSYRLPHLFLVIVLLKLFYWIFKIGNQPLDNKPISPILNQILFFIGKVENKIILSKISIPFGSSLFVICKKV